MADMMNYPTTVKDSPQPATSRPFAAVAGVLAAGIALGVGELLSGLSSRVPSLVARVGDIAINNVPGSIERWAISTFGENDKPALVIGITVIALIVGGLTGVAASKRFRTAWVVFGAFALIGALAAGSDPQRSTVFGWIAAFVSAGAGVLVLRWLLGIAAASGSHSAQGESLRATGNASSTRNTGAETADNRRGFLGAAAATATVAIAAPAIGRSLRDRRAEAVEQDRQVVASVLDDITAQSESSTEPSAATEPDTGSGIDIADTEHFDDISGITPIIVPNHDFYRIDTALVVPQIDVDTWSMKITGMVDREIELSFDDLLAMDPVEEYVTLSCVSNRVGGDLVGNARWLGVPITKLLDMAGVQPGATQIVGRSVDGWTGGFPTAYLDDPDRVALVALAQNGEPLPVEHGFPVRLVVAGLYGYVSATKWLKEIELTTLEDFDGYWIPRGWSKLGPIKTQSRIDVPSSNARLESGPQTIAGVAWAPDRGIDRVEVQIGEIIDDVAVEGPWRHADLSADVTDNSWRQWKIGWQATAGDYLIRVRATDSTGSTQTETRTDVAPDGATGWHSIATRVT